MKRLVAFWEALMAAAGAIVEPDLPGEPAGKPPRGATRLPEREPGAASGAPGPRDTRENEAVANG